MPKTTLFSMGKVFSFYPLNALVIKPYFVTITNPIIT